MTTPPSHDAPGSGHEGTCGHDCRCMSVPTNPAVRGLVLRSDAPTVGPRLAGLFEPVPGADGLVAVALDRMGELRAYLAGLSMLERESIRAVAQDEEGRFDPWSAGPVEKVIARVESPWFPDLLARRCFRFDFQPIVDAVSGEVFGNEALVRADATLPDGRVPGPGELFAAARAHDLLLAFDQRCRAGAIRSGAPAVHAGGRLFINFMPLTIYDPAVCLRTTFVAADAVDVPLDRLVFEVVESETFPDIRHLRAILDAYKAEGAGVALDDLGAGNTAVRYIDELMPDIVKLDAGLLRQAIDSGETSMYRGIVEHCKALGIRTLAEGIERAEDADFCLGIGVDLLQGFGIARPAAEPRAGTLDIPGTGDGRQAA